MALEIFKGSMSNGKRSIVNHDAEGINLAECNTMVKVLL
jgi:hypothetical protein